MNAGDTDIGQTLESRPNVDEVRRALLPPGRMSPLVHLALKSATRPKVLKLRDDAGWMWLNVLDTDEREKWCVLATKLTVVLSVTNHVVEKQSRGGR